MSSLHTIEQLVQQLIELSAYQLKLFRPDIEALLSNDSAADEDKTQYTLKAPTYESLACFEECLNLITLMEDNVEIVFAHEYGSWMIPAPRGYLNAYANAWAQVGTPEQFAEKVGPCLVRDSYQSFADRVYANILQYANPAQMAALQQRIETDKIKIPAK